ncbi:MAG TPA: restriction endonuclease subunit S [Brumimicrobium sp.]|nr:restriction endonuclease subunit S [Brumimicrobium sp.]
MNRYKQYESYKESDISWLGEIPKHWEVRSFKNILIERSEKNDPIKSTERLSLSIDKGVTLYSEKTTNLDRFKDDFTQYKLAHEGDLVLNSMNMIVGAVGVSKYFGCVSPVYYTYFGGTNNGNSTKFYEYLFRSKIVQGVLFSLGRGLIAIDRGEGKYNTLRLKVSRTDLRSLKLPLPPPDEQMQLVNFLDYKLAKINRFIRKKKQLIKLLNEQKAAIINQAVTKGLDPNAPMKDSGIEWLGEIPEHWEIKKLKYSVRLNTHREFDNIGNSDIKLALENIEGKTGRILELSNNSFEGIGTIFKDGDVLFGKLRPYLAKVVAPDFEGSCVNEILVLTPDTTVWNAKFLKYRMLAADFISIVDNSTYGAKMPRASWSFIGALKISRPHISEQIEIVNSIETEHAIIDKLIFKVNNEISVVEEYKTALIAEAVTGKIDVRDFVIPDVNEEQESYEDPDSYREEEEELNMVAEDDPSYQNEALEE